MRGKWARGIEPRLFCWVIKDRLAACERPGGQARSHRKVRRLEELLWLRGHGFTRVVSLLDSPHNLRAYEEMEMPCTQVPLGEQRDLALRLPEVYAALYTVLDDPAEQVLIHLEEFDDRLCGVLGGYLLYAGLLQDGPTAITVIERLTGRQLGSAGREIVAVTVEEGLVDGSDRLRGP